MTTGEKNCHLYYTTYVVKPDNHVVIYKCLTITCGDLRICMQLPDIYQAVDCGEEE